jgi:hypothetical protein
MELKQILEWQHPTHYRLGEERVRRMGIALFLGKKSTHASLAFLDTVFALGRVPTAQETPSPQKP